MQHSRKVLFILAPGFEEIELTAPVDILRRLGVEVCLASVGESPVRGAHGLSILPDATLRDVSAKDYDGVVLPGGPASWDLCRNEDVLQLLRDMEAARPKKLIAAICAAPMVLAKAGVLHAGQRVTCYPAKDVVEAVSSVATSVQNPVVVEPHLVTAMGPACALEFGYALGTVLAGEEQVRVLRREMCAVPRENENY